MGRTFSLHRYSMARRALLMEAALYLCAARLALRLVPFRRLVWFFNRPPKRPEITGAAHAQAIKEVQRAVRMASQRLPVKVVCFPRAIAAQAMLRRRGVGTVLYYGATTLAERGLTAHVWVQDGAQGVIGHLVADKYHVIARYPETG